MGGGGVEMGAEERGHERNTNLDWRKDLASDSLNGISRVDSQLFRAHVTEDFKKDLQKGWEGGDAEIRIQLQKNLFLLSGQEKWGGGGGAEGCNLFRLDSLEDCVLFVDSLKPDFRCLLDLRNVHLHHVTIRLVDCERRRGRGAGRSSA